MVRTSVTHSPRRLVGHFFVLTTTPHHTTPHHTIPFYTTPHHTTLYHSTPHHTIPFYTTPHHTILHQITPHYTFLNHTTSEWARRGRKTKAFGENPQTIPCFCVIIHTDKELIVPSLWRREPSIQTGGIAFSQIRRFPKIVGQRTDIGGVGEPGIFLEAFY